MNAKYYRVDGQIATKLRTVNVLEFINGTFQQSFSFAETIEGNRRAEKKFARLVRENDPKITKKEMEDYLDDGIFEDGSGYQTLITHSL